MNEEPVIYEGGYIYTVIWASEVSIAPPRDENDGSDNDWVSNTAFLIGHTIKRLCRDRRSVL
jgi:hypothetical protein